MKQSKVPGRALPLFKTTYFEVIVLKGVFVPISTYFQFNYTFLKVSMN